MTIHPAIRQAEIDAHAAAFQHIAWAKGAGREPGEIVAALGYEGPLCGWPAAHDAIVRWYLGGRNE